MDDDQLLEQGLEAFDKMNEELAKHQQLFVHFEKAQRQFYYDTSKLVKEATQEALRASQKAVEASKIEIRSNMIWIGFGAFSMAIGCLFIGFL